MIQKRAPIRWLSDFYEYAFTSVPPEGQKATANVLIVTMGYTVALSCFVIGTKVGYALPFWQAVWACVIGNVILMAIGVLMGIVGFDSGWSTTFLIRQMFGKYAAMLVSVLVIVLSVYWVGMNGDSFARMIVTAFPRWPIPIAVTAVTLVVLWGATAAYGWRGLALTSWVLTPLTIVLALFGIGLINSRMDVAHMLQTFVPSGELTFAAAIAAVSGNYIFGCIISPDLCRFAKSRKAVVQIIVPSYTVGFILLNLCGVLVAQLGNAGEFGVGIAKLGIVMPYLICSAMGLWTTENYNMYGGSLAAQNLFLGTAVEGNLSHRLATWILAGLAAAFAALKALNYLMPIITLIAALIPPIAGMVFVEHFMFRLGKKEYEKGCNHWIWIPAWLAGGIAGVWSYYGGFFVSPIVALCVSGVTYLMLRKIVLKRKK